MKVVVAIDDRDSVETALNHILNRNYEPGTQIHLIHVVVPGFADVAVRGLPDVVAKEKEENQLVLDSMARTLKEKLGIVASAEIVYGEILDVIAESCNQHHADEAIVPTHARHGLNRLWFGSVAEQIVDTAPCTVVVPKIQAPSQR